MKQKNGLEKIKTPDNTKLKIEQIILNEIESILETGNIQFSKNLDQSQIE